MNPAIVLPSDHLIGDPELRERVAAVRRAAADGTLLAQSDGPDEIRQFIEEERQRNSK